MLFSNVRTEFSGLLDPRKMGALEVHPPFPATSHVYPLAVPCAAPASSEGPERNSKSAACHLERRCERAGVRNEESSQTQTHAPSISEPLERSSSQSAQLSRARRHAQQFFVPLRDWNGLKPQQHVSVQAQH